MFDSVSTQEWKFENISDQRRGDLLSPPSAVELADEIITQISSLVGAGQLLLDDESSDDLRGERISFKISVDKSFFDKFFNGCHGYRAQFYRSVDCGVAYNRYIVDKIYEKIIASFELSETQRKSILGSQSKIWLPIDAFYLPTESTLDIPRWRANGNTKGVYLPLPDECYIDFKGTFISTESNEIILKDARRRAEQIHKEGRT